MKLKAVENKYGYWRIKHKVLFWWMDTGFPSYDSKEEAQRVVEKNSD